jgi:catecholate siderophore receptor
MALCCRCCCLIGTIFGEETMKLIENEDLVMTSGIDPQTAVTKSVFRGARGWMALGTLAASAMMGSGAMAFAAAKGAAASAGGAAAAAANLPVKRFNIPAGPLDGALKEFEQETGFKVTSKLASVTIAGFNTKGVTGLHPADEGLRLLLEGTGLESAQLDSTTLVVGLRHSETVDVSTGLPDSVAMGKFTEALIDTPQTVNTIPQFVMQDEGATTLLNTLRNVPGISLAAGEGGAQGDSLTIRGFTARNDIFLDGIRDFGSYYRDGFNYEQVDVLEGPAGVEFGRGATGGVINQESKVPQMKEFTNVQTQFGTDLTRRITADINKPIADELGGTAVRVNLMADEGGVAGRPYAELRRFGIAPSVSIGLNKATHATLSYVHLSESDTPDYGVPWLNNAPAPGGKLLRHNYYGLPNANFLDANDDILTLRVQHDFSPGVTLRTIGRAANYPRNVQITEPQICSNAGASVPVGEWVSSLLTSAVNTKLTCAFTQASNPSTIVVNRNQIISKSVESDLWDQTEVLLHFKVLGVRNNFTGGVEGGQEISNPIRTSYVINNINTVPTTNLLNPTPSDVFSGTGYISSITHTKSNSVGLYFVDTIHLGRLFEVSGGVRWDRFSTIYNQYQPTPPAGGTLITPTTTPYLTKVDEQPTYRAAFVYKPSSHGSVYFDWGTSFNPAAESLSLSNALSAADLKPEENETYEGGVKWNFFHERLRLEGAVFRTEKDNARETLATNSQVTVNAGNQLVKGAQMSVVGQLPQGMDIVAGYAYLNSSVIASPNYLTSVGFPLANVPKQTFNLFVTHKLPARFDFGMGTNYVGSRTASSTVPYVPTSFGPAQTFAVGSAPCGATATTCYQVLSTAMKQVPGYWVFNGMVKRPLTDRLELQANVYNILNRYYIDLPHPSHLIPGAGASALIGVNFKF